MDALLQVMFSRQQAMPSAASSWQGACPAGKLLARHASVKLCVP